MTEAEWLACEGPHPMLSFLGARASDRGLRLFSCACCRRAWSFVKDERLSGVLSTVEGFADGTAKDRERGRAHQLSGTLAQLNVDKPQDCVAWELWGASRKTLARDRSFGDSAAAAFGYAAKSSRGFHTAKEAERVQQTPLARDIFGNPFRPVAFSQEWRTDTVRALAVQMYETRDFSAMPILADALQDAGYESEDILSHCRDTKQVHVRGCWVVDLVLGKE